MINRYSLKINPQVFDDIQKGIDYYNSQQKGLGKRFYATVKNTFTILKKSPSFQVRYDDIRCLSVKNFPYLIHFNIIKNIVNVRAVVHTALNPDKHKVNE